MFLHRWKINSNRENFYGTLGNRVLSLLISRQRHYHRAKRPDNIDFIKENKLYSRYLCGSLITSPFRRSSVILSLARRFMWLYNYKTCQVQSRGVYKNVTNVLVNWWPITRKIFTRREIVMTGTMINWQIHN